MGKRLRMGIVGAGVMGSKYARTATNQSSRFRCEVAAICDADQARADVLATEVGSTRYTDLQEMLNQQDLDLVYLAVPDTVHKTPAIQCIEAGVAVLIEKPLATSVEESVQIVQAARTHHVLVEVNFSNRWNPTFVTAKRAIDAGDIGDLIGINARLSNAHKVPESMPWASSTTTGWFLLSHVFDIGHWLSGKHAEAIYARGVRGSLEAQGIDTFDIIHCIVSYVGGASGAYEAAWMLPNGLPSPVDFKFQAIGTRGMIAIDTSNQMIMIADDHQIRHPGVLDWADLRLQSFLDKIEKGMVDEDLLLAGVENTSMLTALHESLSTGSPVTVPLWNGGR